MEIQPKATILFQGDSITDSERNPRNNEALGTGYVMMANLWLSAMCPEMGFRVLNRGVRGNRAKDLRDRWHKDTLSLKPDVVTILIGVNDALGRYIWNSPTSLSEFENNYKFILEQTRDVLHAKIILMEPFFVGTAMDLLRLREDLDPKIEAVQNLSKEFHAPLVPLDQIFRESVKKREPGYWSLDGVHPTSAGHALIALSWLKFFVGRTI